MDVAIGPLLYPLIGEIVFLLLFFYILKTQGARKGRTLLLMFSSVIMFLVISTFPQLLFYTVTPIDPPPEMWSEGYYDSLFIRSFIMTKGMIDSLILLFLILSYIYGIYREKSIEQLQTTTIEEEYEGARRLSEI